jgi:Domain of unknown function (DUF397)
VDVNLSRAVWHKSTFSNGSGGNCVEVARNLLSSVAVRDSKDHGTGPVLSFTKDEWSAFVAGVKSGVFG